MLSDSWCSGKFFVWKKNGEQGGCGGGFPHIGKLDMAFTLVCWPFCKALPKVEGTGEFSTFAHTTCMLFTINLALSQDLLYIIEVDLFAKFKFVFNWFIHQSWKSQKQELVNYWHGHAVLAMIGQGINNKIGFKTIYFSHVVNQAPFKIEILAE